MKTYTRQIADLSHYLSKPKAFFLTAAFASLLLSVGLWFSGDRDLGLFVGLWVPSICSAGSLILKGD
jgi:hypothetical protein